MSGEWSSVAGELARIGLGRLLLALRQSQYPILIAIVLFLVAFAAGVVLGGVTTQPITLSRSQNTLTFFGVLLNNLWVTLALAVVGVHLLAIPTTVDLLINGFTFGSALSSILATSGPVTAVVLLAPHGVLELPAIWLAAAIGFRFPYEHGRYLTQKKDRVFKPDEIADLVVSLAAVIILLVLAAGIEVMVTKRVATSLS